MRIVHMTDVGIATIPQKKTTNVEAIVGKTLGEVSAEDLIHAAHSAKGSSSQYSEEASAPAPLVEVYQEAEEE